jgi:DNA-directed RNA polymerase specialized sigma24 family protein
VTGKQRSKIGRSVPPAVSPAGRSGGDALTRCATAQENLTSAQELSRKWEERRRDAVRAAFAQGIDAAQLAATLGISRAKVYQLIGSARALKG